MGEVKNKTGAGEYGVSVDEANQIIYLSFGGFINKPEDQIHFINTYESAKSKVNQSQATICIDATALKTFPQEILENICSLLVDYSKFKNVYFVEPLSTISKMQTSSTLKKLGLEEKYQVVASVDLFPHA